MFETKYQICVNVENSMETHIIYNRVKILHIEIYIYSKLLKFTIT